MKTIRASFFWIRDVSQQPFIFLLFVWTIMMAMSWSLLTFTN